MRCSTCFFTAADPTRFGITAATGSGAVSLTQEAVRALDAHGPRRVPPGVVVYGGADAAAAFLRLLVPQVVDAALDQIDLNELVAERIELDRIIDGLDLDRVIGRLDIDAIVARIDLDRIIERIDVQAIVERVPIDEIVSRLDLDAIVASVDLDQVVRRVDRLNLPSYTAFVMPTLTPVTGADGAISDIAISYGCDFAAQMLAYSADRR